MSDLISRQDAIDALNKKRIETMEKGNDVNLIWECLDIVAQVSSAQQWIPSEDYIKRDEVLKKIRTDYDYCNLSKDWAKGVNFAINRILTFPTSDVREVVHGEWKECEIVQEDGDYKIIDEWQSAECSVCGKYHTTPYMYHFDHFNYCPHCGAKMDERREDG